MAFADLTAYTTAIASPKETVGTTWPANGAFMGGSSVSPAMYSQWIKANLGASAPSTAAACDNTTTGALGQQNGGASQLFVASAEATFFHNGPAANGDAGAVAWAILADRLSHQGGLSGTSTSAQTTNLPTAALTRYTSGAGVWAALEGYTSVGSTTTTKATISYTNQAGTAGQTGFVGAVGSNAGGIALATPASMTPMTLAAGDTGVRSVESVTLTASTGSVGNFGVTLLKPLLAMPMGLVDQYQCDVVRGTLGGGLPEILDSACLYWIFVSMSGSTATGSATATVSFAEA